ncbi:MAG: Trk system potassium transporter TrkA [Treponema sp.]|jgi:trk system potassium uptake protein TrkA|nr:Trk system potassium transporter TrkA [Treponema sp.]
MKIVIVGAGFTGTQLASHLIQEGHEISLIESNEETARHASNRLDCLVINDIGSNISALEEAGVPAADALICVSESDEVNMIICSMGSSMQKTKKLLKIARVRNTGYKKIIGIDSFIHPDIEAARAVLASLSHGASGNIVTFPGTSYELASVHIKEGSHFDGFSLIDFHSFIRDEGLIALIERGKDCFLPAGSTELCAGDLIYIMARRENMSHVFNLAGRTTETVLKRIGIVGGGQLGSLIAEALLDAHNKFKKSIKGLSSLGHQLLIIEQDYNICKELATRFPKAIVLNEDITDEDFVAEERLGDLDLIITATPNQELNIVTAVYLKSHGVRRAIATVSTPGYKTIALQLGVDVAIPVKTVVVDSILSHLAGTNIRGMQSLGDGSFEIVEVEIEDGSPAINKPVTDFKLSLGGLVMLVNRGEISFIPQGDYVFSAKDKIIIMAKSGGEVELEKFFAAQKNSK